MSLFPHRFDYIYSIYPQPGQKPNWLTESRHPLSDRIITQSSNLFGVRFGPETRYCLLDIDITSAYHPRQDAFALPRLLGSLEPLGLVNPIICTSSYSDGLHVYFPFTKAQRSWKLASALATLVEGAGFKIQSGQLELFPNTKNYVAAGSPSLFNAHRLPLQEPGSYLLNDDLEPIWSDQAKFVDLWQQAIQHNDISTTKLRQVLKQQKRTRYFVSEKADKFLNDLNAEIEPGWTGKGQTNRLLGRITMRCFIFHHVIAGGLPLSGQNLIDEIIATAKALPGYKTWCRHQHELRKRVSEWVRCIENSHYFPYGTQQGKYKAPSKTFAPKTETSISDWNQKQAIATQNKIKAEVQRLTDSNQLPKQITERFRVLAQAGISGSSLYRYKELWHPAMEAAIASEKKPPTKESRTTKPQTKECQSAGPEGATDWHKPPSLLSANACNDSQHRSLANTEPIKTDGSGCNTPLEGMVGNARNEDVSATIENIKAFLAQSSDRAYKPSAEVVLAQQQAQAQQAQAAQQQAYWRRLQGYLYSGEPILILEALDILSCQPESLIAAGMSEALEAVFRQQGNSHPRVEEVQGLGNVLQCILRLRWSTERLQQELRERWQCSELKDLSRMQMEEFCHWLQTHREPHGTELEPPIA